MREREGKQEQAEKAESRQETPHTGGRSGGGPLCPVASALGELGRSSPHIPRPPPRAEQCASMTATAGAPHLSETWGWGCLAGVWWRADGWRMAGRAWDSSRGEGN